jgi:hypothetical protein
MVQMSAGSEERRSTRLKGGSNFIIDLYSDTKKFIYGRRSDREGGCQTLKGKKELRLGQTPPDL